MMIAKRILVLSRTIALVREVQAAAGSGAAVVHHDRVADLEDYLDSEGHFDVLVAGPLLDSRAALARLTRVRTQHPHLAVVLAFPSPPKSPLSDVVRAGAIDLVELPAPLRTMRAVIRRALTVGIETAVPIVSAIDEGDGQPLAQVLTIASPSGGCGKTFYSTNLSHYLQKATGKRVCLVDLDLQFGEVSAALRLRPRYTMTDAVLRSGPEDVDLDEHIEEYLLTHPAGFWVLPAPRSPEEADQITPPDVTRIISALRRHFDYLVLDTSAQLSEIVLTAMDQSTRLICMATLDLPSIRNMRVFIETLEKLKVPTDVVSVILNKVESDMGIKVEEANEALHNKIVSILPYAREVSRSINEGVPVMMSSPKAEISTRLAEGMQPCIGGAAELLPLYAAAAATTGSTKAERAPRRGWLRGRREKRGAHRMVKVGRMNGVEL